MKKTVKDMCGKVAEVCKTIDLSSLLRDYTAQMAIIGVQLAWTAQVTAALDNSRTQMAIIAETAKHQLMQLAELSSWSCTEIASPMTRYGDAPSRAWEFGHGRSHSVFTRVCVCVPCCLPCVVAWVVQHEG